MNEWMNDFKSIEVILLVQRRHWEKRAAAPLLLFGQMGCCLFGFISVLPPPCTTASCPRGAAEEAVCWLRAQLKDGWTSRDFNYGRNPAPVWAARCKPVTSPSRGIFFFTSSYCETSTVSLCVLRIIFDFPRAPPGFPFFPQRRSC